MSHDDAMLIVAVLKAIDMSLTMISVALGAIAGTLLAK